MTVETTTYISGLNSSNPGPNDPKSEGDDHLRLIKAAILATFPNIAGAVTPTHTLINSLFANPVSVASAATVDIGGQTSNSVEITGTTTITSFGTNYNGAKFLRFTGALTLTQSSALNLPGGASITTNAGDTMIAVPNSSANGWNVYAYSATSTTQAAGDNSTKNATTAYVDRKQLMTPSIGTPSLSAGAMTVALNTCTIPFRSSTLTTGGMTELLCSGLSLTVPSGATLGAFNAQAVRLAIGVVNNGGTPVLVVGNLPGLNTDTATLITPTLISSGATSAGVWYSASSVGSNLPFRVVAYVDSTQATAGTYATAPTVVPADAEHSGYINKLVLGSPVVTTTGTAIDYTGIPPWAKRITVIFNNVSTNATGAAPFLVQVGSGSVTTSGYNSYAGSINNSNITGTVNSTAGFVVTTAMGNTSTHSGSLILNLLGSNTWVATGAGGGLDGSSQNISRSSGGTVTLSSILDRVRITTTNGTDSFDQGSVNVSWE